MACHSVLQNPKARKHAAKVGYELGQSERRSDQADVQSDLIRIDIRKGRGHLWEIWTDRVEGGLFRESNDSENGELPLRKG
ncbi:MAG: hypothetical protein Q9216_005774 [Gyalolechia sp. 2 TL-2023]